MNKSNAEQNEKKKTNQHKTWLMLELHITELNLKHAVMPNLIHTSKSHTLEPSPGFVFELSNCFTYTKLAWTFYENRLTFRSSNTSYLQGCQNYHKNVFFLAFWIGLTDRTHQRKTYTRNTALFRIRVFVIPSQPRHLLSLITHCQWLSLSTSEVT